MPRIRTIKPKFWDDSKITKLSRDARLAFIGMWNFTDDLGVIEANPVLLKSKIFPVDQMQLQFFERLLAEMEALGFISLFSFKDEKFYYLPNLTRHQVINRPNYEDVNIQKVDLVKVLANHGFITEQSVQERKGEEGKGKDNTGGEPPMYLPEDLALFEKFQKWVAKNTPKINLLKHPLKIDEYLKVRQRFPKDVLTKVITAMQNRKSLLKDYESAYLTIINWAEREMGSSTSNPKQSFETPSSSAPLTKR